MQYIDKSKTFNTEREMREFISNCGIGITEIYMEHQLPNGKWMLAYTTLTD